MARIIPFPKAAPPPVRAAEIPKAITKQREGLGLLGGLALGIWMVTVLLWGILRWIIALMFSGNSAEWCITGILQAYMPGGSFSPTSPCYLHCTTTLACTVRVVPLSR